MGTVVGRTPSLNKKEYSVLRKLKSAGLTDELAQKVIDSKGNNLAAQVVRMIRGGGFEKQAREIMGRNFFGVEEAVHCFGVKPSKRQLAALSEIPFTEAELLEVKDTHILIAVFPLSLRYIRDEISYDIQKLFACGSRDIKYNRQAFVNMRGEVGWYLVRKKSREGSAGSWDKLIATLGENEEVPTSQVMVYAIIGYYLITGERLFEHCYVYCSNGTSHEHVIVGHFVVLPGLCVAYYYGKPEFYTNLASARKPNRSLNS